MLIVQPYTRMTRYLNNNNKQCAYMCTEIHGAVLVRFSFLAVPVHGLFDSLRGVRRDPVETVLPLALLVCFSVQSIAP